MMPKILLLHGALGSAADLLPVVNTLNQHYDCVVFEFPGHGQTPIGDTPFGISGFASSLGAFVESHQLQGCYVFGYSMGGYVATKLQSERHCFKAIYTLGTKFIWDAASSAKEAGQLNPNAIAQKFPAYAAKLAGQHPALGWEELLAKTADMMLQLGIEAVMSNQDFEKINIPLALGLGDRDKMVPIQDALQVFQTAPKACLDILPYTPHPLNKVNLELLKSRLDYFFQSAPSS